MQVWDKCKFIERCSYCDAPSNGVINCEKLERRESNGQKEHSNSGRKMSK